MKLSPTITFTTTLLSLLLATAVSGANLGHIAKEEKQVATKDTKQQDERDLGGLFFCRLQNQLCYTFLLKPTLQCCDGLVCDESRYPKFGIGGCVPATPAPVPATPAPTPRVCRERGRSCEGANFCCGGLSCQSTNAGRLCLLPSPPPPPPCGTTGTSCGGNGVACCGSLTCQSSPSGEAFCRSPVRAPPPPTPPVCSPQSATCANGQTCCGSLICQNTDNGPTCLPVPTRPVCGSQGTFCGNGGTCCGSLTCQNTNNGPTCLFEPVAPPVVPPPVPICQTRGRGCGDGAPCCGGLTCQATNFGNLCRPPRIIQPPTGTCQSRGRGCGNGVTCCSGLTCQSTNFGNLCRPGRVPVPPPPVPVPLPPVGATFDTVIFLAGPTCANIVSQLDNSVTLFAPTDAAFEAFLSSTGFTTDFLCGNEGVDSLRSILTYHAIPGSITGRDILALRPNVVQFDSLQSETLNVNTVNLAVNGIKISFPDARSTPYVLHGIDGVLTPPSLPTPPGASLPPPTPPTSTSCVGRAGSCANGETCCGSLVCRDTNFGRLCRP